MKKLPASAEPAPPPVRRRRWRISAPLAALLGLAFAITAWYAERQSARGATASGLGGFMEKRLWAWDSAHSSTSPAPGWIRGLFGLDHIPADLQAYMDEAQKAGVINDNLRIEWALACRHFSETAGPDQQAWLEKARASLAQVSSPRPPELEQYYSIVKRAVDSETLTLGEAKRLGDFLLPNQNSWWSVYAAKVLDLKISSLSSKREAERVEALQDSALHDLLLMLVLQWLVPAALLLFWGRSLRYLRESPTPARPSTLRLFRVWPLAGVLGVYFLAQLFRYGGYYVQVHLIKGLFNSPAQLMVWLSRLTGFCFSAVRVLAGPVALRFAFTRENGVLRNRLGFFQHDVINERTWALGLSAGGVVVLVTSLIELVWRFFQAQPSLAIFHGSMNALGDAAFPAHLVMSGLVVPFASEIVYRGFLFATLRARCGATWAAVLSSLLYATASLTAPRDMVELFLLGLACCFVFQRTQKLAPGMILNGVFQILKVGAAYCLMGG